LSVVSGDGEVLLKGDVHMKTKHGKSQSEVTGDTMNYHIGRAASAALEVQGTAMDLERSFVQE
jgi:hypothetical protein